MPNSKSERELLQNNEISSETKFALIAQDISAIKNSIIEIKTKLDSTFVTKAEFSPIKQLVYGFVSLILVAVVGALIALVVRGS